MRIFKKTASSDESPDVRRAAMQELAHGWKKDPETLAWLKECGFSDEDPAVRQAVVRKFTRY